MLNTIFKRGGPIKIIPGVVSLSGLSRVKQSVPLGWVSEPSLSDVKKQCLIASEYTQVEVVRSRASKRVVLI